MKTRLWSGLMVVAIAMVLAPIGSRAWAAACAPGALSTYIVSGFSCTNGNFEFSDFTFATNVLSGDPAGGVNDPADIQVTPESAGETGFEFSNLGLFLNNAFNTNRNVRIFYTVANPTDGIDDSTLTLGEHSTAGTGVAFVSYGDNAGNSNAASSAGSTSNHISFLAKSSLDVQTTASALASARGFGSATVDGYEVTFSIPAAVVPEPGSLVLLAAGIAVVGSRLRRRPI